MLNTLNRLRITRKAIADAIKFSKTRREGSPPYLFQKVQGLRVRGKKLYAGEYELVAVEDRAKLLKESVYKKGSTVPLGRDSLFYAIKQKKLAGVPRRFVADFLRQQPIVTATASKPRRIVRVNTAAIPSQRFFACDLVHVRVGDVPEDYLGEADDAGKVPQSERADRYFLTVVNLLTSYVYVRFTKRKLATHVAVQMQSILNDIKKRFPKGISVMASDAGKEFKGPVGALFKKRKIVHKILKLSPHVESRNAYVQSIFYRVVRMKRGALQSAITQTQNIANSTVHRQLGITPNEAVKLLKQNKQVKRADYKPVNKTPNKPPVHTFKVGQLVRKVTEAREKEKGFYKRYRGTHFTDKVYKVTKVKKVKGYPRYTLDGNITAWHDELIKARKSDKVNLPLFKTPKRKKIAKVPSAPVRRSRRLRGKRVDYHKVQHRYDAL